MKEDGCEKVYGLNDCHSIALGFLTGAAKKG